VVSSPGVESVKPGKVRHFKGGVYTVIAVARHSETDDWVVVYRSPGGKVWVRPVAMFTEKVDADGREVRRFTPITPKSRRLVAWSRKHLVSTLADESSWPRRLVPKR
jgi:hypothetical protein